MATTARLPSELQAEGAAYAERLGISFNALLAVALRDYLDARRTSVRSVQPSKPASKASAANPPVLAVEAHLAPRERRYRAPASRAAPCPCGAKDRHGYAVKWKHCHGKDL